MGVPANEPLGEERSIAGRAYRLQVARSVPVAANLGNPPWQVDSPHAWWKLSGPQVFDKFGREGSGKQACFFCGRLVKEGAVFGDDAVE